MTWQLGTRWWWPPRAGGAAARGWRGGVRAPSGWVGRGGGARRGEAEEWEVARPAVGEDSASAPPDEKSGRRLGAWLG